MTRRVGVSKQQEKMISPAGPVETGPAGFSSLYPLKRVFGLLRRRWRPTSSGNRQRKAANGPGAPLTGAGGKKQSQAVLPLNLFTIKYGAIHCALYQ